MVFIYMQQQLNNDALQVTAAVGVGIVVVPLLLAVAVVL
jgi:hypothetical protein